MSGTAVRRAAAAVLLTAALLVVSAGSLASGELLLPPLDDEAASGDALNILLLGSDEGPMRSEDPRRGRADGFQLLSVSADRQHAAFVSIPRDSWVQVPGRGSSRINACLNGGPERCVSTVEREFGIDVDHYLLTSMNSFSRSIRAMGGIEVDVPRPLEDGGRPIPEAGEQRLKGLQALTYVRDRKNRPDGDLGRSQAQAEVLALIHRRVVEAGDLRSVVEAVDLVRRHTITDIPTGRLLTLGLEAVRLPPGNVERHLLPTRIGTAGAASIVRLEPGAHGLVRDVADDGRVG